MNELNKFIKKGGSFDGNPYMVYGENGRLINFIDAYRFIDEMMEECRNEQLQQTN